jgi:hypothetical protein
MAFKGTEPIGSKIVIVNMILEQVNTFTYLGCNISYQEEKGIYSRVTKFLQILGLLNNTLIPNLIQRSTRLKLYKILALPTLLYDSEIRTIKRCDKNRLRTAEMKSLQIYYYIFLDLVPIQIHNHVCNLVVICFEKPGVSTRVASCILHNSRELATMAMY